MDDISVSIVARGAEGLIAIPHAARGLVPFAHGRGSSRLSPRNTKVAEALRLRGLAAVLFEEPGKLDRAIDVAAGWFTTHLGVRR